MALITSVFLTQLLCLLVPCDPQYQAPDIRPNLPNIEDCADSGEELSPKSASELNNEFVDNHRLSSFDVNTAVSSPLDESSQAGSEIPFVTVKTGVIEGYRIRVVGGRRIDAFEGIPYAEPPLGHLRFRSPVAKAPWKGILKATQYAPVCMQYTVPQVFRTIGTEDCLYLNVYTPKIPNPLSANLPIIVFIHGGGYFFGSAATYGPAYFLQKDIILVTIQYRLGVLGFLSTGDSVVPGNQGLKDQSLALKWVHENIHAFGGDASRVTIMGQSAGSAAVHLHMLSTSSRPYFSGAVSLSGTAFNYWSFFDQYQTRNLTNSLATTVGCPIEDSHELVQCLLEKNPVELVAQTPKFLDDWPYPANAFKPCIEVTEGNPDPFLTDFPANIYKRKEVAKVPWVVTTVSGEGYTFLLFPFVSFTFPNLQRNWYKLAIDLIDAENLDINFEQVIKRLTRFYFRNTIPEKAPIRTYAQIITDRMFVTGIYEAAKAHAQIAPTFSYYFDFNGQYNQIVNFGYPASEWGVGHTEDAFYMFNASRVYSGFKLEDPEYAISQLLVNVLANFAAKGAPLHTDSNGKDVEIWKPHKDPKNLNFLGIMKNFVGMIGDPFRRQMRFWRSLRLPDAPANIQVAGESS